MLALCLSIALLSPSAAPAADAKPVKAAQKPAAKPADKKKADEKQAEEDAKKAAELAAQQKAAADAAAAAATAAQEAEKKAQAEAAARKAAEEQALTARGMDARVRALAGLLALPMKKLPGDYRDQRFAVLPFEDVGEDTKTRQLGLVVSDLLLTDLARDHNLPFVERAALAKVMSEQALGQSGAVAEAQAAQVGQLSGARAIVTGQVADVGASFHVTVRAIDTENATVLTAQEVDLPKEELIAFSAKSAVLKSKSGAFFRSVVAPGWGQLYNGEPVKAGVVGGATGLLLISTLATGATGLYTGYVAYPAAKKEDQPEQIRSLANTEIVVASVLGALTVTTWGIGALDAYLSGTDVESLDAALAKN